MPRPRIVSQSTPEGGRIADVSTAQLRSVVTTDQTGTNVSSPRDELRVNDASEQVRLNASQRSSEASVITAADAFVGQLAKNWNCTG